MEWLSNNPFVSPVLMNGCPGTPSSVHPFGNTSYSENLNFFLLNFPLSTLVPTCFHEINGNVDPLGISYLVMYSLMFVHITCFLSCVGSV